MGSSRLPGKVLFPAGGETMLDALLKRIQSVSLIDEIVLATTAESESDPLADLADSRRIACFRGSTLDVMGRVIGAASSVGPDVIVEITGDCPLIDSGIVELAVKTYLANSIDYVSNCIVKSFPDGMDLTSHTRSIRSLSTSKAKSGDMTNELSFLPLLFFAIRAQSRSRSL